jgi:23S rRNA (cytosine1962-C5)-methyltransferase
MADGRVVLKPKRAKPFFARHPWVYAGALIDPTEKLRDGQAVEVFSHGGNFVARGLYNARSRIRIRLYSWDADEQLDEHFWARRLDQAIALRRDLLGWLRPESACRLVFSEGDGLSGLTVDQYGAYIVVQFTSLALAQRVDLFTGLLVDRLQPKGIYLRTERSIGQWEGLNVEDGPLWGEVPSEPISVQISDVEVLVNLREGQKTGTYLDQRENHSAVARYAKGRRVLDAFCYAGGFGLHAAKGGAREVVAVDASQSGLDLAKENAARNQFGNFSFVVADVFDYLTEAAQRGEKFGMIVLDPPKFARRQEAVENALTGYRRLQALAMVLLEPGGILVTCCCSGLISMEMLEGLSAQTAEKAGRPLQLLERRHQPPDHPVSVSCLESSYLKCLIQRAL